MTYRELLNQLSQLSDDQLDGMDVTVYMQGSDECYPAIFEVTDATFGILDEEHPVLTIEA